MPDNNAAKNILIVRNPRSGAGDRKQLIDQLVAALQAAGFSVQTETSLDRLESMALEPGFAQQFQAVVSAGGDGTASAIATRVPANIPILLFPLGTENLLARWACMRAEPDFAVAALQQMQTRTIDAASANGKLSLIMIGIGYDAEVVHQVHSNRKGHITKWTYGWPMFQSAFQYPFPDLQIQAMDWKSVHSTQQVPDPRRPEFQFWSSPDDGASSRENVEPSAVDHAKLPEAQLASAQPVPSRNRASQFEDRLQWTAKWLFVANLPTYAGGMSVVPNASPDDGYLCAASFRHGYPLHGLWYVANIYLGSQTRLNDYRSIRAKKFRITSRNPARFQVDGDDGGTLPVDIQVLPQRVTLVLPASYQSNAKRSKDHQTSDQQTGDQLITDQPVR